VIKTFADRQTQELYVTGRSKRFPPEIARRAMRKLEYVDLATATPTTSRSPTITESEV